VSLRTNYYVSPRDSPEEHSQKAESSRPERSWSARWLASIVLFLIACFALGYYGFAFLDMHLFQQDESRKFDQELAEARARNVPASAAPAPNRSPSDELNAEAAADLKSHSPRGGKFSFAPSSETPTLPVPSGDAAKIPPPAQGTRLGRIEIASLGVKAMIQEGIGFRTLQRGVGHITGTTLLGQPGNIGLAAHRDTFFRPLRNIHKGDEITLVTLEGDSHYKVEQISIVEPQNSGVLGNTGENILTLVTCYPFDFIGNAPKRFIVRARQMPATR